ncbi:MAG: hypothetical protein IH586_18795 [Anaerolineaceae bacterium]|nr:hypothetical protein [Anaerolineaceae bacterium]
MVYNLLREGYEKRSQRRLQTDLVVDVAAAEAILHLRSQVIELQSHLRQLESELIAEYARFRMFSQGERKWIY